MVFRKPYAFLIKYFKILNLALAGLSGYLIYRTYNIVNFFNEYIASDYSGNFYEGFYSNYISPFVVLYLVLVIAGIGGILWLFIYKKKPFKGYLISLAYYVILFIFLMYIKNVMVSMVETVLTAEATRAYRDISLIVMAPGIIAVIFFIFNFLGFNAKKLNFEADIKELEITAQDDEEIEITFKHDGVKLLRNIRRFFREFVYYVKENRAIFIIICSILLVFVLYTIYKAFPEIVNRHYNQGDIFLVNQLNYTFEDSILTSIDYKGDTIKKGSYFLVVRINVENKNKEASTIDYNNFRLIVGDTYLYPKMDMSAYFIDYANTGTRITGESKQTYSLVYELTSKQIKRNYKLKVHNGQAMQKGNLIGKYDTVTISPIVISDVNIEGEYSQGTAVSLVSSNLGKSTFKINNALFTDKYVYDYEYCINEECETYKNQININYMLNNKTLIVMDYEFTLDETIPFYSRTSGINKFIDNFAKIRYYDDNDQIKYTTVNNVTPSNLKDKLVLEVDKIINDSNSVFLSIVIRNKEYLIRIK